MSWDEEAVERGAKQLFRMYQPPRMLRTHEEPRWDQLSDLEHSDWKFDALTVLNAVFRVPEE